MPSGWKRLIRCVGCLQREFIVLIEPENATAAFNPNGVPVIPLVFLCLIFLMNEMKSRIAPNNHPVGRIFARIDPIIGNRVPGFRMIFHVHSFFDCSNAVWQAVQQRIMTGFARDIFDKIVLPVIVPVVDHKQEIARYPITWSWLDRFQIKLDRNIAFERFTVPKIDPFRSGRTMFPFERIEQYRSPSNLNSGIERSGPNPVFQPRRKVLPNQRRLVILRGGMRRNRNTSGHDHQEQLE